MPIDPGAATIAAHLAQGIAGDMANRSNIAAQERWNAQAQRNWERQFTTSIQTRVKDAQAAGISPLAALGHAGASPPSFSAAQMGGRTGSMQAIAGLFRGIAQSQQDKTAAEAEKNRAEADKIRFETQTAQEDRRLSALEKQIALARTEILSRNLNVHGRSSVAQHQAEPERLPLFGRYYDNREELGPLGPGEVYLLDEEVAESMEGTGALWTALGINAYEHGLLGGKRPYSGQAPTWHPPMALKSYDTAFVIPNPGRGRPIFRISKER